MAVYITGDVHGNIAERFSYSQNPRLRELTENDYMIIAGDFGCIWEYNSKDTAYWLDFLNNKPWRTIVVLGNHENYDIYDEMPTAIIPELYYSTAVKCVYMGKEYDKILIIDDLAIIEIENKLYLFVAGAESSDKAWRVPHISWWPQEDIDEEAVLDFLEDYNGEHIDYIITHQAPLGVNDWFDLDYRSCFGQKLLGLIKDKVDFGEWFHGHLHFDKIWPTDNRISGIYKGIYNIYTKESLNGYNLFAGYKEK